MGKHLTKAFAKTLPGGNSAVVTVKDNESYRINAPAVEVLFDIFDPQGIPYHDDWMVEAPGDLMDLCRQTFAALDNPSIGRCVGDSSYGHAVYQAWNGDIAAVAESIGAILTRNLQYSACYDTKRLSLRREEAYPLSSRFEISAARKHAAEKGEKLNI